MAQVNLEKTAESSVNSPPTGSMALSFNAAGLLTKKDEVGTSTVIESEGALTANELAAIQGSNTPSESNVFATLADLTGGDNVTVLTRVALQALISGTTVSLQATYQISNAVGSTKVIRVFGLTSTTISGNAFNITDGTFGVYDIGADTFTAQGGSQTLTEVLSEGNQTAGQNIFVNNADAILLENGSEIRKGNYDLGGNGGISQICAIGFELNWQAGSNYAFDNAGLIRVAQFKFNAIPTATDDSDKRYKVDSIWILDNGIKYICTNATVGAAVWEVQGSGGGLTSQNSIFVNSVNTGNPTADKLTNGVALLAGLTACNDLDFGTRSNENRGSVVLMPGTYDLGSTTIIPFNFIDIVGLSTDRNTTVITASAMSFNQLHIDFGDNNSGLHNVTLIADVANNAIMLGGGASSFPICENVYFASQNMFFSGSIYGFTDLGGKFNNCEFIDGVNYGFACSLNLLATINDIIIHNVGNAFFSLDGNISGSITNVIIENVLVNAFFAKNGFIEANIANITMGNVAEYAFNSFNNFSCSIVNVAIGNVGMSAIASLNGNVSGTIKNVTIGNVGNNAFYAKNNISATITNITTGNVNTVFYAINNISGLITNLKVLSISNIAIVNNNLFNATIRNCVFPGFVSTPQFNGKIYDSIFDSSAAASSTIQNLVTGAIIERSKFIAQAGQLSIAALGTPTVQILYTITNRTIDPNITVPTVNYNIDDSAIL